MGKTLAVSALPGCPDLWTGNVPAGADLPRHVTFRLVMGARVEALVEDETGHVLGVRLRAKDGWHEVQTQWVIGADGRSSRLRGLEGLEPVRAASPVDFLWFRLPDRQTIPPAAKGPTPARGEGSAPSGAPSEVVCGGYPTEQALCEWNQTSLLTVEVCRLRSWYRPGLLFIGDATHTWHRSRAWGSARPSRTQPWHPTFLGASAQALLLAVCRLATGCGCACRSCATLRRGSLGWVCDPYV
jgi:hypothetical protein